MTHPDPWRENAPKILHIHIATHGDEGHIIRWTFKRLGLESENSSSHAILGLPYDRNAGAQRLTLSPTSDLCVVFRREVDDVVEVMSAYLRLSC